MARQNSRGNPRGANYGRGPSARRGDVPLADVRHQFVAQTSRSVAGIAWRWRNEIVGLLAFCVAFGLVVEDYGRRTAWLLLAAVLIVIAAIGPLRRFVVGRFWCAVSRHRLFATFDEAYVFNRSGKYPLILAVRRTSVGERAYVWCRAGMCSEDLEARVDDIRSSCYARDARVTRHRRWSHIVNVDIVRRDPLAAEERVPSVLVQRLRKAMPPTWATPRGSDGPGQPWTWKVVDDGE
jgi:hypothetical protein